MRNLLYYESWGRDCSTVVALAISIRPVLVSALLNMQYLHRDRARRDNINCWHVMNQAGKHAMMATNIGFHEATTGVF
jgi:hypothetical protein